MRFNYHGFRLLDFLAASQRLVRPGSLDLALAAVALEADDGEFSGPAEPLETVEVTATGLLEAEPGDVPTHWEPGYDWLFAAFTAFPFDEHVEVEEDLAYWLGVDEHADPEWSRAGSGAREAVVEDVEGAGEQAAEEAGNAAQTGATSAILCADGGFWSFEDESEATRRDPAHWAFLGPAQLGYVLHKDGDDLVVQAGALLVDMEILSYGESEAATLTYWAANCYVLHSEQLGDLRERFWAHVRGFGAT